MVSTLPSTLQFDAPRSDDSSTGLLVVECGGTGSKAGNANQIMMDRDPLQLPIARLQIDMDKNEKTTAPNRLNIALSPDNAAELVSNARLFGPESRNAVEHLLSVLDRGEMSAGARTTPALTQLGCIYHKNKILRAFSKGMGRLLQDRRVRSIRPVLVASNGGGSGSALTRLLPLLFSEKSFRNRLLAGLNPYLLEAPIIVTAYPFTYSRESFTERQGIKIMANQYAWLREMDILLHRGQVSHVMSVGFSNSAGTIADIAPKLLNILSTSLHHFLRNYSYFMSRWTDTIPHPRTDRYLGLDLPENCFPSLRELRTKYYGQEG